MTMIKIHKATDGQCYFTVQSPNGNIIVTSETYKTKRNAKKSASALVKILSNKKLTVRDCTAETK